ncbi:MAG: beta-galactosidase [Clostridium sp.]|nr:beta-galactosidase [Clostridium sp.]
MHIYRNEYPNPQFERPNWQTLNGEWDFGFQKAIRGYKFSADENTAIDIYNKNNYTHKINVPFCIESTLSGIGYTDFVNMVWYRKRVMIDKGDNRVFLHIGAADYLTTVLVNGKPAGRHKGGYTSFQFDITALVSDGENEIFILCEDCVNNPMVIRGKQSERKKSHDCDYTRTTGIWQSVYIEYTPQSYIKNIKLYPDAQNGGLTLWADFEGKEDFSCEVLYDGRTVGKAEYAQAAASKYFQISLSEKHLWEVGQGRLYDIKLTFGKDRISSYFGLRDIQLDGFKFLINGKSVFQRLVLDQGFYKAGIYTAPDEEALINDIKLSMELGFNGARLHQKVFEPRFLYHCDKMGYIVWGEYANWGLDYSSPKSLAVFLAEWSEAVNRDFNHPSIVGWCPFNETWDYRGRQQYDALLSTVYDYTKAVDSTRPCIDTSGNFHVKTDIYDVHDYNYDTALFKSNYDKLVTDNILYEHVLLDNPNRQKYGGQPVFVSEYGGIKWETDASIKSWGYGKDVKTPEEFAERYCGLTDALISNKKMFGFCYTQLYDIEQEQNGLYTYDRQKKFSDDIYQKIKAVNTQKAAIE